ncbi:23S rRNA (adenine(2030)-N(6))-methyltransferase RlmJ [Vreelandella titanicae]|uniref:Ribosomal RNA large subunit methyltransferase J n=1 Tax=Vreelandella titanicae TaxID=664683 RepID=A0A558JFN2_9GAMM|nr:23S rRNA (adenine(2030)-N(6))-methyltransferase RlmJ [Halomonas titanicae]TVU92446.1 23S rRNA (adenine(2030)-N(6))-methyltransferase RlmJ [Halomonas titanicae]
MLSYQHAYHAGNFADVHKHLTLYAVIDYLLRKKTAITYVDTHAGRGLYPLNAQETQRLQEYRQGVWPLWQAHTGFSDGLLSGWQAVLTSAQPTAETLTHYPGSPWWLSHSLREQDHLRLFELHPGEHEQLSGQGLSPQAQRVFGDGLMGLMGMLPVTSPRLCVLIDPSYERKVEYQEVAETVAYTLEKARHGVVLIWYPLLPAGHHHTLLTSLKESGIRKIWRSELLLREPGEQAHGMFGSGMLVVNPPWGLDQRLATAMAEICPLLGADSRYQADWWVGE